jgi:uroporphyrinogen decarboxylase
MDNPQNGKELVFAALRHESTPRVPWIPFAGVHAGKLKNYSGREILTDADKLVESLLAVNELYVPDGQPVVFDLQIEAEILGCKLLWADAAPPSVASHPLAETMTIPDLIPTKNDGRLPVILQAMQRTKAAIGSHTALFGLVTGPFTLASHLRGTEIFLDSVDNPDYLVDLLDYTRKVCQVIVDYYIEAGMDVIALVDPLVSQVSPRHFKHFLTHPFNALFTDIRNKGVFSSFFVCGDATKNIEGMCQTGPDSIAIDENIDLVAAKQITDAHNITICGNIPLTTRMLLGNQQDNMKFVLDLLDSLPTTQNFILAPGCDMPFDVPVENAIGVMQAVREPEKTRLLIENYHASEFDMPVEIPDYQNLPRPLIEVFTIDSDTCAACAYIFNAAKRVTAELKNIDLIEYRITHPENISRVKRMGIKNLPCIFINGELKYSSIIPSHREFVESVKAVL